MLFKTSSASVYGIDAIADLEGTENLAPKHLSEAIQYRALDRSYWA